MIAVPRFMTSAAPRTADSEAYGTDTTVGENGAPSNVLRQFEVEHWLRRVQQRYSLRAPTLDDHAAIPETKQKARLGSGATLLAATLQPDVLAAGTLTLDVTCFARGDSTAFLISRSQTVPELTWGRSQLPTSASTAPIPPVCAANPSTAGARSWNSGVIHFRWGISCCS